VNTSLPIIEIILYFSVILLSPVIHIFYLKRKNVRKEEIRTSILIFGSFYLLIAILMTIAILKG